MYYKAGHFSKDEDAVLKDIIDTYRDTQQLTDQQILDIIFAKGKNSRADFGDFWQIVTEGMVDRPIASVYHHTKRIYQPDARQGAWTPEQDEMLKTAVKRMGEKWEAIAGVVGRWSSDCRDRYRHHLSSVHTAAAKKRGAWTTDEEDKLRDIILGLREERGIEAGDITFAEENDLSEASDLFWTAIATRFGGTRSRSQLRNKWNDNMKNKILTEDGKKIRWGRRDTFILVMK